MLAGYQAVSILRGGPATQIRKTAAYLASAGVDVHLFDPWAAWDRGKCDLFHLFSAGIGTYHLAREVHALDVPLVVSPIMYSRHEAAFVRGSLKATRMMQKIGPGVWSDYALAADICSWAGKVLPNTRAEADLITGGLGVPEWKISVVPNGVEARFGQGDPSMFKKRYGLERFILNVGHIGHARKNVLGLVRALSTIDYPSVIIGRIIKGDYGDACVREAAKHRHILLIDGLEHGSEMLASAYAACDVFALPSQFETPGIAALEAGLAGAKVVITRFGGTKEYFGDMAVYVDPASTGSIRDGILRALASPRDNRLREHIRKNFLWEHVAARTAAAYRELLDAPAR